MSTATAQMVLSSIPEVRRRIYIDAAGSHEIGLAAQLYLWNTYMSATVLRTTGIVEVQVRNRMDCALREWNECNGGSHRWIEEPVGELAKVVRPSGNKPLHKLADTTTVVGKPTHDDYVAGLTFGAWARLLPRPKVNESNPRLLMWNGALATALGAEDELPHVVIAQLLRIVEMRNRAAHHRPLIELAALNRCHQDVVATLRRINEPLGRWMRNEKWIPQVVKCSPCGTS